jgi:hypothetical protein
MNRHQLFLELARSGFRAPFCCDVVLHEEANPDGVRRDGPALAAVLRRSALEWSAPLGLSLMDLTLEKTDLLGALGVSEEEAERFRFNEPLDDAARQTLMMESGWQCAASRARDDAMRVLAAEGNLFPIGMCIGPFSLTTNLMADAVTATALAGTGVMSSEEPQVRLLYQCLEVAEAAVGRALRRQVAAGAAAILLCEPAASTTFLSPR